MSGFMQTSFFFGYNAVVCYAFFLMLGTIGFRASMLFVRHIYRYGWLWIGRLASQIGCTRKYRFAGRSPNENLKPRSPAQGNQVRVKVAWRCVEDFGACCALQS